MTEKKPQNFGDCTQTRCFYKLSVCLASRRVKQEKTQLPLILVLSLSSLLLGDLLFLSPFLVPFPLVPVSSSEGVSSVTVYQQKWKKKESLMLRASTLK